jgi:type I restriction enzyme, R subunit
VLEPFADKVEQRFNLWLGREKKAGREYSEEQTGWLRAIASFIAANAEIGPRDFMEAPSLTGRGGIVAARRAFGEGLNDMLEDLQGALVA